MTHQASATIPALQSDSSAEKLPHHAIPQGGATSRLPGRLWTQAYEAVKKDNPRLVDGYETLLHRVLVGESSPADNPDGDTDPAEEEQTQAQMVQLVEAGLKKTEREAATKLKVLEGMRVVSSVRDLIGSALKHAPEAATAWGGVFENPVKEASANRDGMAHVISRIDWYWNLSSLLLEENRKSTAGLEDQLEQHIVGLYKKFLSYQMKSVCSYYHNRVTAALRDMVKFDNWVDTVQSIKDDERIVQEDINTYNRQEVRKSLNSIAEQAEHRRMQLQDIHQAIQDQTAALREMRQEQKDEKQEEKNEKCLADLCTTDPRKDKKRIQRTKGGLLKDSYKWILKNQNFRTWRQDHGSRLLWVKGNPGKGKTMLLCGIIDELENSLAGSGLLSYFFCQGTDSQINNATAVLRGLIYLLVKQQTSLISHVREMYGPDGKPLFREMNAWDAFSESFEKILRDPSLKNTYLIIDALDECETDLPQLLKLIVHNSSASPRVKWIVSSRNRPEIEQQLKLHDSGTALSLELSENAEQVTHAVGAYIDFKVSTVPSLQDDDEERNQVRDIMCQKANGTFLWVALVIKELENPEFTFSHDGQRLASASVDKTVKIWGPASGSCMQTLEGHSNSVKSVAFSHDSQRLASASSDRAVKIWDPTSGRCVQTLEGHRDSVNSVAFSHDGQRLASASSDTTVKIWDPTLGSCMQTLEGHSDSINSVAFSHDSQRLASASSDTTVKIWDPTAGSCVQTLEGHSNSVNSVAFSHDGQRLASASSDRTIKIWDPVSGSSVQTLEGHRRWVWSVAFLHDGQRLASASFDETVKIWDPASGSSSSDMTIKIWDPALGSCMQTLEGHRYSVNSVAFSQDGQQLASASDDTTIKIWDPALGSCVQTLEGHRRWVNSVAFSHDSQWLASASSDTTVKIWDPASGSSMLTLEGHSDSVNSVAFSHDGQRLASASVDKTVKIWDPVSGSCVQTIDFVSADFSFVGMLALLVIFSWR
ncbi:uncharacterized protein DNG_05113 [Cephalotrichum gorgonifer]|uniref:NACHT domain-containing protein n=1 Tax=Cephalotrichum gorgonifer TaxID=2041049 RepID=A0AAE8N064_9PEZI|nr:uncharacterized protein DNG_05113 [Cephalotrichum gorgonifer]